MNITLISPGNKSLEFIEQRIKDPKYRGSKSSQHNRYLMEQIIIILSLLNKYSPDKSLMTIRTTDLSKRPENKPEEIIYSKFCNEAKEKAGIGTQDAMRKNLFVDIHRMGLIQRYDKEKIPIDPLSRKSVKYVSITDQGLRLINAKNLTNKYFIFSKGIDMLLGGYIDTLLDIFRDKEFDIGNINLFEYMFFVSAVGTETNFNINSDEAVNLIKSYRRLTNIQKRALIETLKQELNPKNFKGDKTDKRDFHNWKNKIEQIFYLLNQTVYFEVRGQQLVLKQDNSELNEIISTKRLNRSLNEKYLYFVNHKIDKTNGFELHHIVPLSWSESIYHFKILDTWKNMVYIDGYSHAKISQNNNRNILLLINNNDLILKDYSKNEVYLKYKDNVLYNTSKKIILKEYNTELLKTIT